MRVGDKKKKKVPKVIAKYMYELNFEDQNLFIRREECKPRDKLKMIT